MRSFAGSSRLVSAAMLGLVVVLWAPTAAKAQKEDERLVCIGALAGAHIYTTYGYIGGAADSFAQDVYKADRVQELMREVIALSDVCIGQLKKVREGNIIDMDKKVIDDVIEVYELLKKEASSLSEYSKSKSKEDLDAFETARTTVWPKIKNVLGIKDEPEAK